VIAKKGLEAASVENIAAAAGYTRGAFYSNFSSKDDLFIELSSPAEMTAPIAESLLTLCADSIMRLARLDADSTKRD